MQPKNIIPPWLKRPDLFSSRQQLQQTMSSSLDLEKLNGLPSEYIPNVVGYINHLIYRVRFDTPTPGNLAQLQLQRALYILFVSKKYKDPRKFVDIENLVNLSAILPVLNQILKIITSIIQPKINLCFQSNNFVLQLLLLCREIDALVVLEVLKKHASQQLYQSWNQTIRRLDKLCLQFFTSLKENKYEKILALELQEKHKNDKYVMLVMECMRIKFELIFDEMGRLNRHEKKKTVRALAERWQKIADLIQSKMETPSSRQTAMKFINTLKNIGIMQKTFLMIESCVNDFKFVQNDENCTKVSDCFYILSALYKGQLDKNWNFYRAVRLIFDVVFARSVQRIPTAFHNILNKKDSLLHNQQIVKKAGEHFIQQADMRSIWLTIHQCRSEISLCQLQIWNQSICPSSYKGYKSIKNSRKMIKKYLAACINNFKQIRLVEFGRVSENTYEELIKKLIDHEMDDRKIESLWAERQILQYIYAKEFRYQRHLNNGLEMTEIRYFMGMQWQISENQQSFNWKQSLDNLYQIWIKGQGIDQKKKILLFRVFAKDPNLRAQIEDKKKKFKFHDRLIPEKVKEIEIYEKILKFQELEIKEIKKKEEGFYDLQSIEKLFCQKKFMLGWCEFINMTKREGENFLTKVQKIQKQYPQDFALLLCLHEMYERHSSWVGSKISDIINMNHKLPYISFDMEQRVKNKMKESKPKLKEYFIDQELSEMIQILHVLLLPDKIKKSREIAIFNNNIHQNEKKKITIKQQLLAKFITLEKINKKNDQERKHQNQYCYTISLVKIPQYNLKERYREITIALEKVNDSKCLQDFIRINSVQVDKDVTKIYVFFQKIQTNQINYPFKKMLKEAIKKFNTFRKEFQEFFPYWHCLFNPQNFTIVEKKEDYDQQEGFTIQINPFQPFFLSQILPFSHLKEKYLAKKNPKFSFIDFADVLLKQKKSSWFTNQCMEYEFMHMISEMRAIEMQSTNQDKVKQFLNCPFFWSSYRKIVQVATFKQNYQSQINYEQSRRKTNERNKAWLENHISQLEKQIRQTKNNKNLKQKLAKAKQKMQDYEFLKQRENDIRERNQQKERENDEQLSPVKKKKVIENNQNDIDSIEYKYAKGFNRATQMFYSIEGIMEKAAYEENIGEFRKDQNEEGPCYFGLYKWLEDKSEIKEIIEYIAEKERKKGSAKANLFQMTYSSFQNHLRWMRNICVHSIRDTTNIMELTHEQKIQIIEKNYPKFFIFLFRYRNVIGKPLTAEIKEIKNIDIKYQITKTLNAAFRENSNNSKHIAALKRIKELQKYNIDPYDVFGYEDQELGNYSKKCKCCDILGKSLSKIKNFWEFLNDIKKNQFNILFFEHLVKEGVQPCQWANKDWTILLFLNCIKRDQLTAEQLALVYDKPALQAVQNNQSINKQFLQVKGSKRTKIDGDRKKKLREKLAKTDYIPQVFLHEVLYEFPSLLDDLRYNRYQWDERVFEQLKKPNV